MDKVILEIAQAEFEVVDLEKVPTALTDLQLAFVGGGIADVAPF